MTTMTCPENETADPQGPAFTWIKASKDRVIFILGSASPDGPAEIGAATPRAPVARQPSSEQTPRLAELPLRRAA